MEQSLAPGSQTFEQDLFRLYREDIITLDEALANADSPTNLSWLINNSEIEATPSDAREEQSDRNTQSISTAPSRTAHRSRNSPSISGDN